MDIKNNLLDLAKRVPSLKSMTTTEEATKNAFVMPFLQILGYNVFNPAEIVPEFTSDVGTKKGEKVDYAIIHNGSPTVIIECKHWQEDLKNHDNQLVRYFSVSTVRFGILTNGIEYRFYTDLDKPNIMDEKPFFEFSLENLKDSSFSGINKFLKEGFDLNTILDDASVLKYSSQIKMAFSEILDVPSDEFIKVLTNGFYKGKFTQKVLEDFRSIVKKSTSQYISEKIQDRLEKALNSQKEEAKDQEISVEKVSEIISTEDEIFGFQIIKAIGAQATDPSRIYDRDTKSYFGVLFDDNNRKPIARLHFNGNNKYLETFAIDKTSERHLIENVNEIYSYADNITAIIKSYK